MVFISSMRLWGGLFACLRRQVTPPTPTALSGEVSIQRRKTTLVPKSVYSSHSGTGVREGVELSLYHFLTTTDHFQPCGLPSGGSDSWQGAWKEEVCPVYT